LAEGKVNFTKRSKILFFLVFFILLNIIMLEIGFFTNIYPLIYVRFGLAPVIGNNIVGWIIFGNFATIGISTLFFGYFGDKYDRMKVLFIGILAWSILSLLCALSQDFVSFMILRILLGVGEGAIVPIGFSMMMDMINFNSRSRLFAVIGILNFVGPLLGVMLRGSFDATTWQQAYLVLSFIGFGFTALIYFMKEPERASTEEQFQKLIEEGTSYNYRIKKEDFQHITKRPTNLWLIINFIDTIIPGLLVGWLLFYIGEFNIIDFENFHINQLAVAWPYLISLGLVLIGLLAGTFIFAHMGDKRVDKDKTIRAKIATWCSIITIPFIVVAFLPGIPFLSIWMGAFAGLGMFFMQGIGSNWYASIMDLNLPENRGTMIALATLVDTFGRGLGGLLGGYISYEMWFLAILIIQVINMVMWLPVLKYISGDIKQINELMEGRAQELKKLSNT